MDNKIPLVIKSIEEMSEFVFTHWDKTIGFVPTMGYLHRGHLSLVESSLNDNELTVVSIFVNPTQFGENEDFDKYPRDLDNDLKLMSTLDVDVVFYPENKEIYPDGYKTFVEVYDVGSRYCGKSRPIHFRGVTTIVCKLLNIVKPTLMYMGEKDFQQIYILEKMIDDLNISSRIIRCPIIRESDGLAMSSRNVYLSENERKVASCLYQSMLLAKEMFLAEETDIEKVRAKMEEMILANKCHIDYIAFINNDTFVEEQVLTSDSRVLLAVKFGTTRLIDNMRLWQ